jgi:cytochrome b
MTVLYPAGFSFFTALPGLALAAGCAGLVRAPAAAGAAGLAYLAASAAFSAPAAAEHGPLTALLCFTLFPVVHLSYAAGWWGGMLGAVADRLFGLNARRCACGKEIS